MLLDATMNRFGSPESDRGILRTLSKQLQKRYLGSAIQKPESEGGKGETHSIDPVEKILTDSV